MSNNITSYIHSIYQLYDENLIATAKLFFIGKPFLHSLTYFNQSPPHTRLAFPELATEKYPCHATSLLDDNTIVMNSLVNKNKLCF